MGLMDMISGRTSRKNHIHRLTYTEPLGRIEHLQLQGFLKDYAVALAFAVSSLVECFVDEKDSFVAEYAIVGKNATKNAAAIYRLAAYCAYWLQDRFVSGNPGMFLNAAGAEDETSAMMRRDLEELRPEMYPDDESIIGTAISMQKEIDRGDVPSGQLPEAHNRLFSLLLGIPRDDVPFAEEYVGYHETAMKNYLAISALLISYKTSVQENLAALSAPDRS